MTSRADYDVRSRIADPEAMLLPRLGLGKGIYSLEGDGEHLCLVGRTSEAPS